jgi:hypothetical protein
MITKEEIIKFLKDTGKAWRYTEENNIVTQDIIYFLGEARYDYYLIDIGVNNLPDYQNWDDEDG